MGVRLCVIAGNISPIDVITHVPILCEESDIPYIYVPSKEVSLSQLFCTPFVNSRQLCMAVVIIHKDYPVFFYFTFPHGADFL